jgi:hypothetical protein
MKKLLIALTVVFALILIPALSEAGTLMIGIKGWAALWDSAVGETFSKSADNEIEEWLKDPLGGNNNDARLSSDLKLGMGALVGPMLSYQTDDKLWSFSLALMHFGSFSQEADVKASTQTTAVDPYEDLDAKYILELNRKEYDLAVTRSLTGNLKVFVGYKHQITEQKFKGEDPDGNEFDIYEVDVTIKMPTAGIGYIHPLSDRLFLGIQLGLLYVMPTVEYTDKFSDDAGNYSIEGDPVDGEQWEKDFDKTFGFNGEASLSYLIGESVIVQAGYRYQQIRIKMGEFDFDEWDTFHGVTLSAVYLIGL